MSVKAHLQLNLFIIISLQFIVLTNEAKNQYQFYFYYKINIKNLSIENCQLCI